MPLTRENKIQITKSVEEKLKGSESVVFVNFHGLDVSNANELRSSLKTNGVGYSVVKKTLLKRALADAGKNFAGAAPALDGEVALAYSNRGDSAEQDILAPARGIHEFQVKTEGKVKIIGGVFDNQFKTAEEMNELALIPSRDVLYGKLVFIISWPLRGLVSTLSELAKSKSQA